MSEELPPLPKDVLSLLDAERAAPPVDAALGAKIFGRLELSLGLPTAPAGPAHPPAPPAPPPPAGAIGALTKAVGVKGALVLAVATGAVGGGSLVAVIKDGAPERVVIVREPAPAPALSPVSTPTVAPSALPASPQRPRAPAPPQLDERQRMLLERARVALARGDAAQALATLEEHRKTYPASVLEEEREALSIRALLRAGRGDEARLRFLSFQKRFPKSMSTAALRTELAR